MKGRDEIYILTFQYGYVDNSIMLSTHLKVSVQQSLIGQTVMR
jgi:hypothetical protein